ncbi:AMP-binding protein [Methylobacterium aerolatum]|uniref:Acetyl-CoA synthetase n=1 Tax=Methylobacterium aerolatum TaxID=418708 RepID=A0ABU0I5F6_9HYPH|nr:AMP-binding protein [Methylobacterium aerolatum]MDQ0449852.1 acetyl-CoA synthetase [Methylobacterium aerolatum]GJD36619.1 Acetyl-coenzyme A synthetase [Methylobacterium aerolatum]
MDHHPPGGRLVLDRTGPAIDRTIDHRRASLEFDAAQAFAAIFPEGPDGINACHTCCDRHADDPRRVALRYSKPGEALREITFATLARQAARFADVLAGRGVGKGDRVAGLLPRTPELLVTILATWRLGAVYQPLFTAFGPKAIEQRVREAGTKVVVTDLANRPKAAGLAGACTLVTVGAGDAGPDLDFWAALEAESGVSEAVACGAEDPFLIMFTSGTTGPAKPLFVPLKAIVAFVAYMRDAVDLRLGDRFWNVADPGWAYGLYYAVTGPLAMGLTTTFHDGPFTVEDTYRTIRDLGITNLAGSPTAFRFLIAAGPGAAAAVKGQLRAVSSAGEPLNPEVIRWFAEHLGTTIHDHYGQTELGMVVCNHHALAHPVRLGSAGFAVPGHRVVVVDAEGRELGPGEPGILAVDRTRSPLMWFSGYWERPTAGFVGDYYLSGDTVEAQEDGSIAFVGRADDVITSSGYRIGPFEVESALIEHPAVAESAVVGKPDPDRTELVKAFVVLKGGVAPDGALAEGIQRFVKQRLSAHSYPREIEFVEALPKTPSGKLQRFILRNQEVAKVAMTGGAAPH